MKTITYTAARQNLAKTMESVCQDHAPVIVTRKKNDSVVIMSLEDYEALEETAYLLRSPKNARRLMEAIAELEEGGGTERELVD
jgi:antitoxin YefM